MITLNNVSIGVFSFLQQKISLLQNNQLISSCSCSCSPCVIVDNVVKLLLFLRFWPSEDHKNIALKSFTFVVIRFLSCNSIILHSVTLLPFRRYLASSLFSPVNHLKCCVSSLKVFLSCIMWFPSLPRLSVSRVPTGCWWKQLFVNLFCPFLLRDRRINARFFLLYLNFFPLQRDISLLNTGVSKVTWPS